MRVWDCLGVVWLFENNHSSLFTQFSSLVTHHSSLKIPQFSIPHPFGTYFSASHYSIFFTLCGTHTWALGQRLPTSPSFPTIFFTSHFPFTPSALLLSQNTNPNPCEYIVKLMSFLFFYSKTPRLRLVWFFIDLFFFLDRQATKPDWDFELKIWKSRRATSNVVDERQSRRATPLMKNLKLKEKEKQSSGSKILEIVWIEKFVYWFWRLMGLDWDDGANGGVKKDGEDGRSELRSVVVWRWWYSLPKKKKKKMVGLSSDRWWYEDGGIVYQRKKEEDGGIKMEEWSCSHWWREPLQVVSKGALLWSCSDRGSHVCVFNYQNAIKTQFW